MNRRTALLVSSVVALGLIGAVAYVALNKERTTLDATARAEAPGKFVQLHDGITHYDLSGPDTGRTIVLLSGATVPFYIWDPTRDALVANGFRVLRYNYFGRGFSDRPKLRYDLATYDRQLSELLDTLGVRGPVDIAGISMGGVIAANFADRHADRGSLAHASRSGLRRYARHALPAGHPGSRRVCHDRCRAGNGKGPAQ